MKTFICLIVTVGILGAITSGSEGEAVELQQLRKTYDEAVQRAVRPLSQAYLQELNRTREMFVRSGRQAEAKQVDAEIALVSQKLEAMVGAVPSTVGHRTVVLESRVNIPANSPDGYSIGAVRQGDVITLQYLSGLWKGHGSIPTDNPDELDEKDSESRLVIARGSSKDKPGEVIVLVPSNTSKKAFSFTFPTTRDAVVLRINKNSDNKKNPGSVTYQIQVSR